MNRQVALGTLVKVRTRRLGALEEAVKLAVKAHQRAVADEEDTRNAVKDAVKKELAGLEKLQQLTDAGQTFDINELTYQQDHAKTLKANIESHQQSYEQKIRGTAQAKQTINERRLAVTRNEQKTKSLKDQLAQLRQAAQLATDDAQDEESEESAISRMIQATGTKSSAQVRR
jgi:Bacterial type III secretion protein (HrpB7)